MKTRKPLTWGPEYYASLPTKRMASGALFTDDLESILVVKPWYKDFWEIPGGIVENGESPRLACEREVQEELGVTLVTPRLLCIDYTLAEGERTESLQFIFWGGVIAPSSIQLNTEELDEFRFVNRKELVTYLPSLLLNRVHHALEALKSDSAVYIESAAPLNF